MVVLRSVISYLHPAIREDTVCVATWLLPRQSKVRVTRRFQAVRDADGATLARAEIDYACVALSTGRPSRWPPVFVERYTILDEVAAASGKKAAISLRVNPVLIAEIKYECGHADLILNSRQFLRASSVVRLITTLGGQVRGAVGIASLKSFVVLHHTGATERRFSIMPNSKVEFT